jgi:C1A family cysteine protease
MPGYRFYNRKIELRRPGKTVYVSTGWLPPIPDLRDYTIGSKEVKDELAKLGITGDAAALPDRMDLRKYCSPIENQGNLGACSAHAAVGIVEYFERRAFSKHIDGSRRFVYKNARNLMGETGDTGAWLRSTMGALVLCGIPPEEYWPYTDVDPDFDEEPSAFVYSFAENFKTTKYFCHDPAGRTPSPELLLKSVKECLSKNVPSMFAFYIYPSFDHVDIAGGVPYPSSCEMPVSPHAVSAMGYNDNIKVTNTQYNIETKGALLIRNSWGDSDWGEFGYGWLPYDYVLTGLALDFWSLIDMKWVDTANFRI